MSEGLVSRGGEFEKPQDAPGASQEMAVDGLHRGQGDSS